jgi:hypothetical protein
MYLFVADKLVAHIVQAQHIDSRSHHLQPLPRSFAGWQPAHHQHSGHWHISMVLQV